MASAEPDDEPGDEVDGAQDDVCPRPVLQQRVSPFVTVITTVHPQGLVIQVNRLFRQRVAAVNYERLVLDPTTMVSLRPDLLWTGGIVCGVGLLAAVPAAPLTRSLFPPLAALAAAVPWWLSPALLLAGVLTLLAAMARPRRVTMFLDREAGLHPSFLRDRDDDAEVAGFLNEVRRAIIAFRCRPPPEDEGLPPEPPRLVATLDALIAMRQQDLLTEPEFDRFRELALRR